MGLGLAKSTCLCFIILINLFCVFAMVHRLFGSHYANLGKRELVCVLLVHLFVCFVHVSFCHFSLPLGVGGWLQFVIVALPGLFY